MMMPPNASVAPFRIGVLVSGRGSNLQALLAAFPANHPQVQIVLVVSNRPGCPALEHAQRAGVTCAVIARDHFPSRVAQHAAIGARLHEAAVDLVVLAGYDQIVTPPLLELFADRIINIHPSLLPAFAGTLHAPAEAVHYGVKISGCTVHYVTAAVDGGPILAQAAVPVLDDDDAASLAARILEEEHQLLPRVVEWIAAGRVHLDGRRVRVEPALHPVEP
jgi:phosphoribosylglycinamide formyltransferase-1